MNEDISPLTGEPITLDRLYEIKRHYEKCKCDLCKKEAEKIKSKIDKRLQLERGE